MEGFYSKVETGRILGVSTRQVDNYIKERKLRRIKEDRKVWIPKGDVELLYKNKALLRVPTMQEIVNMQTRMDLLEKQVRILQRGLGFGTGGAPMSEVDLRLLYQKTLDDLREPGWPITRVMEFTEELRAFREEDLDVLLRLRGPHGMLPFFDLARRMVTYVESHDQYPDLGTKAVRDRLIQSRKIVLALVEVTLRIETSPFTDAAAALYKHLGEKADLISSEVGKYIAAA